MAMMINKSTQKNMSEIGLTSDGSEIVGTGMRASVEFLTMRLTLKLVVNQFPSQLFHFPKTFDFNQD
jgi:hypothetical protein